MVRGLIDAGFVSPVRGKRREYLREYLRWLWPHRYGVAILFVLALIGTGLQMIEPLFMRFIIDRVLLNTALDTATMLQAFGYNVWNVDAAVSAFKRRFSPDDPTPQMTERDRSMLYCLLLQSRSLAAR